MTGHQYDAPNQQVVRADGSGPADEGSGGSGAPAAASSDPLDDMTKDELIDVAAERGVSVSGTMTKAEIRDAIDAG
jgi:hypothetical protein